MHYCPTMHLWDLYAQISNDFLIKRIILLLRSSFPCTVGIKYYYMVCILDLYILPNAHSSHILLLLANKGKS